MSNIEFGEWITVDTTPKPRRKRVAKPVEVVETRPIVTLSNACMLNRHELCSGILFSYKQKRYVNCECNCGICLEYKAGMELHEIVELDKAWKNYQATLSHPALDNEHDAFRNAWIMAKEYFNAGS